MPSERIIRTIIAVAVYYGFSSISAGASHCSWEQGFWIRGLNDSVNALAVYDDGTGPALIAGGSFTGAGPNQLGHIAKWDGSAWSALGGPGENGIDGVVYSLAVYDDGNGANLYAGGDFMSADGATVNHLAKWNGSEWSAVGTGTDGIVLALTVYDDGTGDALFAGGSFTNAGGLTVNGVARWDGSSWSGLSGPSGTGVAPGRSVRALAVHDDGSGLGLYAGGSFNTAGGVTVNRIAKWNGSAWSALTGPSGTGVDSTVVALAVYNDGSGAALFAGGTFATAGGVSVERIAKWDGAAWSALSGPSGTGVDSTVRSLTVFGGELYAGGSFVTAGGVTAHHIAKWNGTTWSALSGSGTDAAVDALTTYDDGNGVALYAGGFFHDAGGVPANFISRWNGTSWFAVGVSGDAGDGINETILALATFDDGSGAALYAGGSFTVAGGTTVNHVATWNGSDWSALSGPAGTGIDGPVHALAVYDDGTGAALYAAGTFTTAGGVTVNNVAKWNGTAWSSLSGPSGVGVEGAGCTSRCARALGVYDDGNGPALYVGGAFSTAGGLTANHVARWDGKAWSDLSGPAGNGTDGPGSLAGPWALVPYDDGGGEALYAAGFFEMAGGVAVNHVAKWDGNNWSALTGTSGTGLDSLAETAAVFDDGSGTALYVAGDFSSAGGIPARFIARWDGTEWSELGGPPESLDFFISLAVYDDGHGSALYGGGAFQQVDDLTVNNIARWDGGTWSALSGPEGTGLGHFASALAEFDDGNGSALFAGGSFTTAGGVLSTYIGKWSCPALVFADGFESGDTSGWSVTVP